MRARSIYRVLCYCTIRTAVRYGAVLFIYLLYTSAVLYCVHAHSARTCRRRRVVAPPTTRANAADRCGRVRDPRNRTRAYRVSDRTASYGFACTYTDAAALLFETDIVKINRQTFGSHRLPRISVRTPVRGPAFVAAYKHAQ